MPWSSKGIAIIHVYRESDNCHSRNIYFVVPRLSLYPRWLLPLEAAISLFLSLSLSYFLRDSTRPNQTSFYISEKQIKNSNMLCSVACISGGISPVHHRNGRKKGGWVKTTTAASPKQQHIKTNNAAQKGGGSGTLRLAWPVRQYFPFPSRSLPFPCLVLP